MCDSLLAEAWLESMLCLSWYVVVLGQVSKHVHMQSRCTCFSQHTYPNAENHFKSTKHAARWNMSWALVRLHLGTSWGLWRPSCLQETPIAEQPSKKTWMDPPMKVQFWIKILLTIVQGAFQTVVILCWVVEKVFAMQSGANELGSILVAKTVPKLRIRSWIKKNKNI